ncbi:MAG: oligosaccharide flippase family protein [Ignavibacteriaceae bacterium]|jgi:O-antigen/teichoic acid export membrane protein
MKKSNLFKSVAWYGVGNIIARSMTLILLPLYSNLISTKEFGNYSLLVSVYTIIATVYQFGMSSALNKFYTEEPDEKKKKIIFSTILNSIVVLGIILTVVTTLFSTSIVTFVFGSKNFSPLLILLIGSLFFETINFYIILLLKTKEMPKETVVYSVAGAIVNLGLNILFVFYFRWSISGIILAQLLSGIILFFISLHVIKGTYIFIVDKKILLTIVVFSLPLLAGSLFTALTNVADRFIINIFMSKDDVGIYSFVYRIALLMNVFVVSFAMAWNPHSVKQYFRNNYSESYGKTLSHFLAGGMLLFLFVSLFIKILFETKVFGTFILNPIYKPGLSAFPFIMAGYFFNGISTYYAVYPYVSNKTYQLLITDFIALSLNIGLNYLLIPKLGLMGAAISTAAAFFFGALYLFFISKNKLKINYEKKEMSLIIIGGIVVYILGTFVDSFYLNIILLSSYSLLLYKVCNIQLFSWQKD